MNLTGRNWKKRLTSALLTLVLVAVLLPAGGFVTPAEAAATQTTSPSWTLLSSDSTTGYTIGSSGSTTYYYLTANRSFTNSTYGGSGLTIAGTVYLYIPTGVTLTATGAAASGSTGGGAGIHVPSGTTLYLIGGGTVIANGGAAAQGATGDNGSAAISGSSVSGLSRTSIGGAGGNGGGGAGAGIGTPGGTGGTGRTSAKVTKSGTSTSPKNFTGLQEGYSGTSAPAAGTIYTSCDLDTTEVAGGSAAEQNSAVAKAGDRVNKKMGSKYYIACGGGGGGNGGSGLAGARFGTGGGGGGGGSNGGTGQILADDGSSSAGSKGSNGSAGCGTGNSSGGAASGAAATSKTPSSTPGPSYTVTYHNLDGTTSTASYYVGSATTLTLAAHTGAKWKLETYGKSCGPSTSAFAQSNDNKYTPGSQITLKDVYGNLAFTAVEDAYTVSFNMNSHGTAPASQAIASGGKVTKPTDPTATGYTFGGWYKEQACTNEWNFSTDTVTANTTLYAKWTPVTYTVSYNANGGTGAPGNQTKTYGTTLTLSSTKPTRTGYTFLGWSTSSTATSATYSAGGSYTNNSGATLYAVWQANTYSISYAGLDGATCSTKPASATYGTSFTVSNPTKTGYHFAGWSITGMDSTTHTYGSSTATSTSLSGVTATSFNNLRATSGTVTFTATWRQDVTKPTAPSAVTYTGSALTIGVTTPTGTTRGGTYSATNAGTYTATYTPNSGYCWTDGTTSAVEVKWTISKAAPGVTAPSARKNLEFNGTALALINAGSSGHGTLYYYSSKSSTTPTATAAGWSTTIPMADSVGDYYVWYKLTADSNHADVGVTSLGTITVAASEYTVTFDGNGGETEANPASITETYGGKYTLPTMNPTKTGYTFDGWFTANNGGTQVTADTTVTITAAQTLYAHWTVNTYTVTYHANGGADAPDAASATYDVNLVIKAAPTWDGHTFKYWNTQSNGEGTTYNVGDSVKNLTAEPNATVTLYAIWSTNQTLTYNAGGHGTAPESVAMQYDKAYSAADAITGVDGYTFNGWNTAEDGKGTAYAAGAEIKAANTEPVAITLYAQWTANTYAVTFDKNGGETEADPKTQTVTYDGNYVLPTTEPSKTGYTFIGWFTAENGGDEVTTDTKVAITAAQTLYAHWEVNTYTVTLSANGAETCDALTTYTYGVGAALPTPTRTGYTFGGWFEDEDFTGTAVTEITATDTGDKEFYAKWTLNTYTVTFNANGHDTAPEQVEVKYGALVTKPDDLTEAGYTFGGWYKEAECTNAWNFPTDTVTENTTLYAKWEKENYTVTFDANGHGTAPTAQTVAYEDKATEPAAPTETGYTFGGWYKEAECTNEWHFATDTVRENTTLYAKWTASSFTVTFEMCDHGTDLEAIENVAYGATIEKPTDPTATGYNFGGWYTNAGCNDDDMWNFDSDTVKDNTTLYAKWTANTYTVTLDNQSATTAGSTSVTATYGSAMPSATMPTRTGYSFLGYFTNENGEGDQYYNADGTGTMPWYVDDNVTLYAHWKKDVEIGLNLLLDGDTGMVFTVTVNNEALRKTLASDGCIKLSTSKTEKEVSFKEAKYLSNGQYECVFNVNALEMAEKVTIKVCSGGNVYAEATTSVEGYYNLIKDGTDYGDNVKSLAKALVNYGYYAQQAVEAENYAPSTWQDNPSIDASVLQAYKAVRNGEKKHVTKFAFSLLMENKTTLCLYFQTSDGKAPEIRVDGVSAEVKDKSGESWLVRIPNIDAMHLADVHKIETDGYTYYVSALSYGAAATGDSATAICALYDYYKAALAYSGKSGIASATADATEYTYTETEDIAPELTVTTTNGETLSEYTVTWDGDLTTAGKHVGIVKGDGNSVLGGQVVVIEIVEAEPEGGLPAKSAPPKEPADDDATETTDDPTGEDDDADDDADDDENGSGADDDGDDPADGDPDEPAGEPTPEEPANKGDDENGSGADDGSEDGGDEGGE